MHKSGEVHEGQTGEKVNVATMGARRAQRGKMNVATRGARRHDEGKMNVATRGARRAHKRIQIEGAQEQRAGARNTLQSGKENVCKGERECLQRIKICFARQSIYPHSSLNRGSNRHHYPTLPAHSNYYSREPSIAPSIPERHPAPISREPSHPHSYSWAAIHGESRRQ